MSQGVSAHLQAAVPDEAVHAGVLVDGIWAQQLPKLAESCS